MKTFKPKESILCDNCGKPVEKHPPASHVVMWGRRCSNSMEAVYEARIRSLRVASSRALEVVNEWTKRQPLPEQAVRILEEIRAALFGLA